MVSVLTLFGQVSVPGVTSGLSTGFSVVPWCGGGQVVTAGDGVDDGEQAREGRLPQPRLWEVEAEG